MCVCVFWNEKSTPMSVKVVLKDPVHVTGSNSPRDFLKSPRGSYNELSFNVLPELKENRCLKDCYLR